MQLQINRIRRCLQRLKFTQLYRYAASYDVYPPSHTPTQYLNGIAIFRTSPFISKPGRTGLIRHVAILGESNISPRVSDSLFVLPSSLLTTERLFVNTQYLYV